MTWDRLWDRFLDQKYVYRIAPQDIRLCFDTATFNEKHAYESYILPEKNFTKT